MLYNYNTCSYIKWVSNLHLDLHVIIRKWIYKQFHYDDDIAKKVS